jgi:hypothetical protein
LIRFTVFFLLLLALGRVSAQPATAADFDLRDRELFPAEFFPGLHERSQGELLLAGLRSLFPKRILVSPPQAELPEPVAPLVRPIGRDGTYIRVFNLAEALPEIERHLTRQVLLLDFRFLSADLESTMALGALLTRQSRVRLQVIGDYPVQGVRLENGAVVANGRHLRRPNQAVFTLSNHETRGPIEALLQQLKHDGDTISVGTGSAGQTAAFRQFPELPSYYLIRGEIRGAEGSSLLENGFVPRVSVTVSQEEDLIGYSSLRGEVTLEQVVQARVTKPRFDEARLLRERGDRSPLQPETAPQQEDEESPALDLVLQRAMNIVKALQALGQIAGS